MKLQNNETYKVGDALYKGQCNKCEERLEWEAEFDADGSDWHAQCCNEIYWIRPSFVKTEIYSADE